MDLEVVIIKKENYISYEQYLNIINNKETAIVIFVNEHCIHCHNYKNYTLSKITNLETPLYFYEFDFDLETRFPDINSTPTTRIIVNGKIEETITSVQDYETLINLFEKYNIN